MRDKLGTYIIEITLAVFLLLSIIFTNIITRQVIAIVLLVYMIISKKTLKNNKVENINKWQIAMLMGAFGIIYIGILYILGIYFGYYKATIRLSLWSIINYIIPYTVIIISAEEIRKAIILKKENIKANIIILIAMIMLDIALSINISNLKSLEDYVTLIGFIIFSSIANNLLYNYIVKKYKSNKGIIIYKIITTIYLYIIPITPDIYIFLEAIIRMIFPYIIYMILNLIYEKNKSVKPVITRRKEIIIGIIPIVLAILIVMLISCKFKYGLLVIGSGSMTGTINKGDIIIYESYDNKEEIEEGDIIVFKKEGLKIVHRVVEKKQTGKTMKYYTKGDANPERDEGYREDADIIGIVKGRIPYLGNMTLWLNDIFRKGN